jgi:hypothetical protein
MTRTAIALSLLSSFGSVVSFDFLGSGESEGPVRETSFMDRDLPHFMGNRTHRDYFKLLKQDGLSVLVGARNMVYNLSLPDLVENEHEVIIILLV